MEILSSGQASCCCGEQGRKAVAVPSPSLRGLHSVATCLVHDLLGFASAMVTE